MNQNNAASTIPANFDPYSDDLMRWEEEQENDLMFHQRHAQALAELRERIEDRGEREW